MELKGVKNWDSLRKNFNEGIIPFGPKGGEMNLKHTASNTLYLML